LKGRAVIKHSYWWLQLRI